ncbi:5-methylcytosine restriction system specificity protein McrC [Lactobacillus corticis]|uniref:McrBC 5-methylcytosine restriction system component n=1 Tax=Lactobacillus corticis TaxID=2201249 RepID=A0A916VI52_9LACO|nr:hypothetical protein [Lactobacillus corticis]GFZ27392.1 hypothetical protein LCB40_12720 [Lactobacillus corticis]
MSKLFYSMPCLSSSREFHKLEIYQDFFDKKVDKRYLEVAVRRFIELNQTMLDFLGIKVVTQGAGEGLTIAFQTSNYIGAIPLKMPYDGIARKDFQVLPRFDLGKNVFADLTQILAKLEFSISPEFADQPLCSPMQLKPPVYTEAVKYLDLFEAAYRYTWRKFDTRRHDYAYPKASTDWQKYSLTSSDPRKALVFPARDSFLTTDHLEWRKLRYVFDLAREILLSADTPAEIRYRYLTKINNLTRQVANIQPQFTKEVQLRAHDPKCITEAKQQANVVLKNGSTQSNAWRMDMAELFERYVQTIAAQAARELSGKVFANGKIHGSGHIPSWGLKYLEPDITIRIGERLYMADAKYKANYYARLNESEILKETHRADLHQILAYCSFEPQNTDKTGILFYPANETSYRVIDYSADRLGGLANRVVICGLAFGLKAMDQAPQQVKQLLQAEVVDEV